jgi:hypothetical protein
MQISKEFKQTMILGLLIGGSTYWNGITMIGSGLFLMVLIVFSEKKIQLIIIGLLSLLLVAAQIKFFTLSSTASPLAASLPQLRLGMIMEKKSLYGIGLYFLKLFGLLLPMGLLAWTSKIPLLLKMYFFLPILMAFTVQLTPDLNANHKFVLLGFTGVLPMALHFALNQKKKILKIVFLFLLLSGASTGLFDLYSLINISKTRITLEKKTPLGDWAQKYARPHSTFITPYFAHSPLLLLGHSIYLGWPYFPWSAGHDTDKRLKNVTNFYAGKIPQPKKWLAQEGIQYVLITPKDMTNYHVNYNYFNMYFDLIFESGEMLKIYQVK